MRRIGNMCATYVGTREVVNWGLGQHGVVLQLGLAQGRSVAGDDDELGLAGSQTLQGRLVAESDWKTCYVSNCRPGLLNCFGMDIAYPFRTS